MNDHRCLFCGAQLEKGRGVSRTMIKGHVQVLVVEYPCPQCEEGTEIELPHFGEFCDRAADLLGDRLHEKVDQPKYKATFDDEDGWVFTPS